MHTFYPQDVRVTNQPVFEALGTDIDTWSACVTGVRAYNLEDCPNGYGPTLALPTSVPSVARMNLTSVCFPIMATIVGLFFTYSPKHLVVWKGWVAPHVKVVRPKAEVHVVVSTTGVKKGATSAAGALSAKSYAGN